MSKHVIIAHDFSPQSIRVRYFLGYQDDGADCEPHWTVDPWNARWFDDLEVVVETALLARLCPDAHLQSWSLDGKGESESVV